MSRRMRARTITALLLVAAAVMWLCYGRIRPVAAQAAPQAAGNGGVPTADVTASTSDDTLHTYDFLCFNNHPVDSIRDFGVCVYPTTPQGAGKKGEIQTGNVDADNNGTDDGDWDVDDNGNGTLQGSETDSTDDQKGTETHIIKRDDSQGLIGPNGEFRVSGTVKVPKNSGNWKLELTTTNKKKPQPGGGEPAGGGTMADTVKEATEATNSFVTQYVDNFAWLIVGIYAKNMGVAPIRSVTVEPPPGTTISTVETVGEMNDGTWNPSTKTFTFSTPVQPSATLGLNVVFENLAGDQPFTWEVNY